MQEVKNTFTFAATGTELTKKLNENGVATIMVLVTPNFTNNSTTTMSVINRDSKTIWTDSARNEDGTYLVTGLSVPVDYGFTLKATLSTDAGGTGGTVDAYLYVEARK